MDECLCFFLSTPVHLGLTDVRLIADLSHTLCLGEEFLSLVGICLLDREVTNLTQEEVVELIL